MKPLSKKILNTNSGTSLHGVLVDVYGVGILLSGPSGVGKSECALDLIARGHRLVADDLVLIRKNTQGQMLGYAPDLSRYHMEVRGLGILNVRDLYGAVAVREEKRIDMLLELVLWKAKNSIDRLGIELLEKELLGQRLPLVRVPSRKGRNLTTIIEVAARNQILRWSGKSSALEFEKKHRKKLCNTL